MTSFNGSSQRKPGEVSFLGEISDEDSSDSGDEYDKGEGNYFSKGPNYQAYGKSELASAERRDGEYNKTDKQTTEVKDSSEVTSNSLRTVEDTSNTEASSTGNDLSSMMKKTDGNLEVKDSSAEDLKLKDSFVNTSAGTGKSSALDADLSTTNAQTEGKLEMEGSSMQNAKLNDPSVNTSDSVNDTAGFSGVSTSSADLSGVAEKGAEKIEEEDFNEKQKHCEKGSCVDDRERVMREFVEGSVSGGQANAGESRGIDVNSEGIKMDTASERKGDVKSGDVKFEDIERELANTDLPISVAQNVEQTVKSGLTDEKSDSVEEQGKEDATNGQEGLENGKDLSASEEGLEKQQDSEDTNEQQDGGKEEHATEEKREIPDTERSSGPVEEKKPESQAKADDDTEQLTESVDDNESDRLEAKQVSEKQNADES